MILKPRFANDLAGLPTSKFGPSSLTWWGILGFMIIEGVSFALTFGAYFYLMGHEQGWPPEGRLPPDLLAGTIFTLVILLSEIPNTLIKKAARAGDVATIRRLLPVMVGVGIALLIIRGFEFNSLNCRWYDNAYASMIWTILLMHATHLITDWMDTVVLWALIMTPLGYEQRRLVDVDENSMYWRYVWLLWIPVYLLIYWVPRL
ncbi:MAG TPA: cytochrome c oxidase subunit 3 [Sphingomicrobium sp.]|nr:cytochrome c oxidase subunit 3 [Sphingomicrobium sp.]